MAGKILRFKAWGRGDSLQKVLLRFNPGAHKVRLCDNFLYVG